jgi:SAM-dependent methyltransferase
LGYGLKALFATIRIGCGISKSANQKGSKICGRPVKRAPYSYSGRIASVSVAKVKAILGRPHVARDAGTRARPQYGSLASGAWFSVRKIERIPFDGDVFNLSVEEDESYTLTAACVHNCRRAVEEAGARFLVDTSVLAGHQDYSTGRIFGLGRDCKPGNTRWLRKPDGYDEEKKAIDLGAGGTRRTWEGYKTYTTDIRSDVGADYVLDTRLINLPSEHFDLVASSHHLEHIPRWEQDQVWKEIFRICKPGGKIEHIIPNVKWAAAKYIDEEEDEHAMNVLYGAQEAHGYERIFNLHYYGYSPRIARLHALEAGFVDVETESYEERPELGYNLIIRGRKPTREELKPLEAAAAVEVPTDLTFSAGNVREHVSESPEIM